MHNVVERIKTHIKIDEYMYFENYIVKMTICISFDFDTCFNIYISYTL